jgi:hypothetical protein
VFDFFFVSEISSSAHMALLLIFRLGAGSAKFLNGQTWAPAFAGVTVFA